MRAPPAQPRSSVVVAIERAIMVANIGGITPQNDGNQIRLFMPPLTEERRRELFRKASSEGEQSIEDPQAMPRNQ